MKLKKIITLGFITLLLSILIPNQIIKLSSKGKTYSSVSNIPKNRVGVILGANKYVNNGRINLFYKYRLDAAVSLFKSGKIDIILVSGDNGKEIYDEPTTFKNDLILQGIPEHKIFLDYAGFRTLDSMVRAKEVFDLDSITVISQEFHNERAIFLAQHSYIKTIGFNAKNVNRKYATGTIIREYFARTKAVLDIILGVEPKFYGKTIKI